MPKVMYLIRHAEAEGNIYRRAHGQYNSNVTINGRKQIEALCSRLAGEHIDRVYSSDLRRAKQTAAAVAKLSGLAVNLRPGLREHDLGDWEDKMWGELEISGDSEFENWCLRPNLCKVPGGESTEELAARAWKEVNEIAKAEARSSIFAVFSHGVFIRSVICQAMGMPLERLPEVGWSDNTGITAVEFGAAGVTVPVRNDSAHLHFGITTTSRQNWWKNKDDFNTFIRLDTPDDFEALLKKSGYKGPLGECSAVAHLRGTPVGFVSYNKNGKIRYFFLIPEVRKRRVSYQLLGHVVSQCRHSKVHSLWTENVHEKYLPLIEKMGFSDAGDHYFLSI